MITQGFLARWSQHHDMADAIKLTLPTNRGLTYLGPRNHRGSWNPEWQVYDAYLPPRPTPHQTGHR